MEYKKLKVKHFIGEPIIVQFSTPPPHSKKPTCPDSFIWRGENYQIDSLVSEWRDFSRRGRMANNMQPQHAQAASKRGSWGVGRFFFEVLSQEGNLFRLYYDRAPKDAFDRSGSWFLLAELMRDEE